MRTRLRLVASVSLVSLLLCLCVSAQDGLGLFHKMQQALGGADKIAAVRDFEQLVNAESFDANGRSLGAVRKRTRWVRPNLLRIDQVGQGSTYVLYFDGTSGWEILPGTAEVIELAGGELKFAQGYGRGFLFNLLLADRDPRYQITSPSANVVRISEGDITHNDFILDPATRLPLKTATISLSNPSRPVPSETVNMEWETVEGIRFVKRFAVYRSGIRVAEATVEKTTLNAGLKAADLAAKPSDFKPVFAKPE